MDLKEVLTPQEVADFAGVTVLTVYRWIKDGKLKATKLGQWKISRADLLTAMGLEPEPEKEK